MERRRPTAYPCLPPMCRPLRPVQRAKRTHVVASWRRGFRSLTGGASRRPARGLPVGLLRLRARGFALDAARREPPAVGGFGVVGSCVPCRTRRKLAVHHGSELLSIAGQRMGCSSAILQTAGHGVPTLLLASSSLKQKLLQLSVNCCRSASIRPTSSSILVTF